MKTCKKKIREINCCKSPCSPQIQELCNSRTDAIVGVSPGHDEMRRAELYVRMLDTRDRPLFSSSPPLALNQANRTHTYMEATEERTGATPPQGPKTPTCFSLRFKAIKSLIFFPEYYK